MVMRFGAVNFVVFFPIVILIYYILSDRWKKVWLLAANYYFYMCLGFSWAILLQIISAVTYFSGILTEKAKQNNVQNLERKWMLCGCIISVTVLGFMKYGNVILPEVIGKGNFNIFLPIGLSFYSLQAISYVIDVYKGKIEAEKNYIDYSLYLSFFPTIQSGPVEKARDFLPQLKGGRDFDYDMVRVKI